MSQRLVLILYILVHSVCTLVYAQIGTQCTTPNNETAYCIQIKKCEPLIRSLRELTPERQRFLKESLCGFDDNKQPLVCCGYKGDYNKINFQSLIFNTLPIEYKATELLPPEGDCGLQTAENRVFYGNETTIDEYPWMALLGYRHTYGDFTGFNCGGVLLNKRYVLTAAHCVHNWKLYKVRLGEHDVRTEKDCACREGLEECNDPAVDYLIEEIFIHPDYFFNGSININDIALIRLKDDVNFTFFIKPICLPVDCERSKPGDKTWVAGWGLTEQNSYSPVKRKVDLTITEEQFCMESYKKLNIRLKGVTQLCALGENKKDSCKGDSGGPLMKLVSKTDDIWYVIGIVSFGPTLCGLKNVPGVYTDVVDFIQWILETMTV